MSGKFMSVKRIIVPTITICIIASQIMGCAAVTQSEMLQMINRGDSIEIEVAAPLNQEQGTEQAITWIALDKMDNYKEFRGDFEVALKISQFGKDTKNGIAYIDLEGNQEGNNTLYNAFMNRKFISNYWENEAAQEQAQEAVLGLYTDVEDGTPAAKYAALNAYWNLLPDAETNYFNGDSTLTRAEAMALVMRAENKVTDDGKPEGNADFTTAVGTSDYTDFASAVAKDSYLDIESKSLDNMTFNGTITRGEYIYMLVHNILGAEAINNADLKTTFSDCKDGGDIATAQKFIEDGTKKNYWKSYELTYALQNPDGGAPTELFKGLCAAKTAGIIEDETRFDEGVTKTEAIQLLVSALQAYTKQNGYPVDALSGAGAEEEKSEEALGTVEITDVTPEEQAEIDEALKGEVPVEAEITDEEIEQLNKETGLEYVKEDPAKDVTNTTPAQPAQPSQPSQPSSGNGNLGQVGEVDAAGVTTVGIAGPGENILTPEEEEMYGDLLK